MNDPALDPSPDHDVLWDTDFQVASVYTREPTRDDSLWIGIGATGGFILVLALGLARVTHPVVVAGLLAALTPTGFALGRAARTDPDSSATDAALRSVLLVGGIAVLGVGTWLYSEPPVAWWWMAIAMAAGAVAAGVGAHSAPELGGPEEPDEIWEPPPAQSAALEEYESCDQETASGPCGHTRLRVSRVPVCPSCRLRFLPSESIQLTISHAGANHLVRPPISTSAQWLAAELTQKLAPEQSGLARVEPRLLRMDGTPLAPGRNLRTQLYDGERIQLVFGSADDTPTVVANQWP